MKPRNKAVAVVAGLVLFFGLALSCTDVPVSAIRAEKATARDRNRSGPILVGVVQSGALRDQFLQGVRLAVDTVNNRGGVLGRKIEISVYDDRGDIAQGQRIAKQLAGNSDIPVVVGHGLSEVAIAVSMIYEEAGMLFISYGAMNPIFIAAAGQLVLSNIITEKEIGAQIGDFLNASGPASVAVAVLVQRSEYGVYERIGDFFASHTGDLVGDTAVNIAAFRAFSNGHLKRVVDQNPLEPIDFYDMLWNLKQYHTFDAMFVAGDVDCTAHLIRQAHRIGIDVPILAVGENVDPSEIRKSTGEAAREVIVAVLFDLENETATRFAEDFRTRFGSDPGVWAIQGYDAILALVAGIENAGSTVPTDIATAMRFFTNMTGVAGDYRFSPQGGVEGKRLYFRRAWDGMSVEAGDLAIRQDSSITDKATPSGNETGATDNH